MADSKKQSNNVGGTLGAAIGLISVAAPIVTAVLEKLPAKSADNKAIEEKVIVPELYTKGFPLTLDQANEKLTSEGFKIIASKLTISDANIKYKDCFDMQVVDSQPKSKAKTKPGVAIIVRYITQDVIDESKKLFIEDERRKAEAKAQKLAKRAEQKDQAKQVVSDVTGKAKSSIGKIFTHHDRKETEHEQE